MNRLICIAVIASSLVNCERPKVQIPDGTLEGLELVDYDGNPFYAFKRIPFAEPPIGEQRFTIASKNKPWIGIRDATQELPSCVQPNDDETAPIGTEDCLYLNVFTPTLDSTANKAVMVFIHGGKFLSGSGGGLGADFLMPEDIVLVTINYRLGVYGFINLIDTDAANRIGNVGFKDQVLALKWVQANIHHFGGDAHRVTIAGESAGGMSVHGHILSPLSTGLFHRAIPMSGSTLMVMVPTANNTALDIARYLNIDTSNHRRMIDTLRHESIERLFHAQKNLKWFEIQLDSPCQTALVVEQPHENAFVDDYPLHLIHAGNYNKVPMLIGATNMEGLLIRALQQENVKDLSMHVPFFFNNKQTAALKIERFYHLSVTSDLSNVSMYTDAWFRYNAYRTAREHSRNNNQDIFLYEFSLDAGLNFLKSNLPPVANYSGACHADDLGYLFKHEHLQVEPETLEERLMKQMASTWATFVKTGKCDEWQSLTFDEHHFVNITNDGLKVGVYNESEFHFWDEMYAKHSDGFY